MTHATQPASFQLDSRPSTHDRVQPPEGAKRKLPFRVVEFDRDHPKYIRAVIFPVVDYPLWMRESRSSGPVTKTVVVALRSGEIQLGRTQDSSGLCTQAKWDELLEASDVVGDSSRSELLDREAWGIGRFTQDPSFHYFASAMGRRDPWPALREAIAQLIARSESQAQIAHHLDSTCSSPGTTSVDLPSLQVDQFDWYPCSCQRPMREVAPATLA